MAGGLTLHRGGVFQDEQGDGGPPMAEADSPAGRDLRVVEPGS